MRVTHLLAGIAAAAVATTACKKTPKPAPDDEWASPSPSTSSGAKRVDWTLDELEGLHTTSPVQGITIWAQQLDRSSKALEHAVMFEHGRRCLPGATENECTKSWRLLVDEQRRANARVFAIVTRDVDRHELLTEEAQLRALLGPIDTPGEAAILASFLGASPIFVPQCDGSSRTIVMEKANGGYSMALEKRVRKGELTKPNGLGCTDCIIAERRRQVVVRPSGDVDLGTAEETEWIKPTGCGRSPGWSETDAMRSRARCAGEYLAQAAHLEAASVAAFERIARELAALGAPAELVARAHRAAIEETAHARILGRLARDHGALPPPFHARPYALRSAFELALDNAVEGCVNETYGALVLHVQALLAEDAATRAAFARIAEDEASHAELSADLADWLDARLSRGERAAVRSAAMTARAQLDTRPAIDDEAELRRSDYRTRRRVARFTRSWTSRFEACADERTSEPERAPTTMVRTAASSSSGFSRPGDRAFHASTTAATIPSSSRGSVPFGSSPRATARVTIAYQAPLRSSTASPMTAPTSGSCFSARSRAQALPSTRSLKLTLRRKASTRSRSSEPVSGNGTSCTNLRIHATAAATSCFLPGQRR